MLIEKVTTSLMAENCYVLSDPERADCVVIDPGGNPARILAQCGERKIAAILLTHCHFDHIAAVPSLKQPDIPLIIHELDAAGLTDPNLNASALFIKPIVVPPADITVQDGAELNYAGLHIQVLHTPGHTAGSVCYLCEDALFTGDTVMSGGGVGRTDLPSGSEEALHASLLRLMPLLRRCNCYGGH